jgi:hypothetical protein
MQPLGQGEVVQAHVLKVWHIREETGVCDEDDDATRDRSDEFTADERTWWYK